jgi:hypothetical protein
MWLWWRRGPCAPVSVPARSSRSTGRPGFQRLERVDDDGQFLVIDLDQFDGIGGDVAVGRHDEGDLLPLEQHLAVGQHHLLVTRQRGHPVQAQRCQVGGGQHGDHARQRLGGIGVDRLDAGMGIGAADEIAEQHALHLDVVDVVALALREPHVLDPLAAGSEALEVGNAVFDLVGVWSFIRRPPSRFISAAAARIALTMF